MADDQIKVSDTSAISMPIRNLVSIIIAISIGSYALFEMQSRLQRLEVFEQLITKDLEQGLKELQTDISKNNEFRIKWPRGELGQASADQEQYLLIEVLSVKVEKIQSRIEKDMSNGVNITRLQTDMLEVRSSIEKLKDKQRGLINGGTK
jgi:biopolymer transport protein ExbB/TolQ|tara:strand:- start:169 stop:618 length:450 start_codon:yes stop_codon:yes gene_type:complete